MVSWQVVHALSARVYDQAVEHLAERPALVVLAEVVPLLLVDDIHNTYDTPPHYRYVFSIFVFIKLNIRELLGNG